MIGSSFESVRRLDEYEGRTLLDEELSMTDYDQRPSQEIINMYERESGKTVSSLVKSAVETTFSILEAVAESILPSVIPPWNVENYIYDEQSLGFVKQAQHTTEDNAFVTLEDFQERVEVSNSGSRGRSLFDVETSRSMVRIR